MYGEYFQPFGGLTYSSLRNGVKVCIIDIDESNFEAKDNSERSDYANDLKLSCWRVVSDEVLFVSIAMGNKALFEFEFTSLVIKLKLEKVMIADDAAALFQVFHVDLLLRFVVLVINLLVVDCLVDDPSRCVLTLELLDRFISDEFSDL